jgi:hypothetical protein
MGFRRNLALGALLLTAFSVAPAAEAAEPALVLPTCSADVEGAAGTEVLVDPQAVVEPIVTAVQGVDAFGGTAEAIRAQWSAVPPIPAGRIGDGYLSGTRIADAAMVLLAETPAVQPILARVLPVAHATVGAVCGVVTHVEVPNEPLLPDPLPSVLPRPADPLPPQRGLPPATQQPRHAPDPRVDSAPAPGAQVPRVEEPTPQAWPWLMARRRVVGVLEPRYGDPELSSTRTELTSGPAESVPNEEPSWALFVVMALLSFAAGNWIRSPGDRA